MPRASSATRCRSRTVCLGWHWQPYKYTREATDVNGRHVLPFPGWMTLLGPGALTEAYDDPHADDGYAPDTALVNYYDHHARLGMHQDRDERADDPVVSLSIGDSCLFRFGNTRSRGKPHEDVLLASGDLFVFGGPSRFAETVTTTLGDQAVMNGHEGQVDSSKPERPKRRTSTAAYRHGSWPSTTRCPTADPSAAGCWPWTRPPRLPARPGRRR